MITGQVTEEGLETAATIAGLLEEHRARRAVLTEALWPDAVVRFGTSTSWPATEYADAWHAVQDACTVTHHLFNDRVDIQGDVAYVETYYVAVFAPGATAGSLLPFCGAVEAGRVGLQGGRYVDRLERRGTAWRIASRHVCAEWFATAPGGAAPRPALGPGCGSPLADIEDLLTRESARDCVYRFARALDRADVDLLGATVDGTPDDGVVRSLLVERDTFPVQCTYVTGLDVDGRGASADVFATYLEARLRDDAVHLSGGRLQLELRRSGSGWRIAEHQRAVSWRATADGRHTRAFHRATGDKSHRSREDGSYQAPVRDGVSRTAADLLAREGVRDALARYARGADRLDRDMLASAHVDVAPQFLDYMLGQAEVRPIQDHCWTNLRVELAGESTAWIEAYYISVHGYVDGAGSGFIEGATSAQDLNLVAGRYVRRLDRVDGRWGLRNLSAAGVYPPPNGGLGDWHAVLDGSGLAGYLDATGNTRARRGGTDDPSYERP